MTNGCPMAKRPRIDVDDNEAAAAADQEFKERLREFDVLDELNEDDEGVKSDVKVVDLTGFCTVLFFSLSLLEDGDEEGSEDSEYFDDIEQLLDADLPEELKRKKEQDYEERYKMVLEDKGKNHFEVLPEGWLQATHNSGMPIYLHKATRVCTTSKPYFLGPGSVRVSLV